MDFVNETNVAAGWTTGFERDGREILVVAGKATFPIPSHDGEDPALADEQLPLIEADEFAGDPGLSSPIYESEYDHRKPMCDVLLNGSAYAPGAQEARRVPVVLRVGQLVKTFNVLGNRMWWNGMTGTRGRDRQ